MSSSASHLNSELEQLLAQPFDLSRREPVLGFTLDSDTSRDLDDAIWIEPTRTGAIVSVHIADVTSLIPPHSLLERQALEKIETRYLARGNQPMFPRELSENKLSLLENQLRPTVTVRVTLDESAKLKDVQLLSTHLTSLKQFSYPEADATLHQPVSTFFQLLRYAELWAQKLAWQRRSLGAIGQTMIGGVALDEEGKPTEVNRYHSQQIIQEFMVLANTAVAHLAEQQQLPLLYRNHTASNVAPEHRELIDTLMALGLPELIRQKLQSWLNPASYSPAALGHFALSLPAYTHFTSPIRRLADYINHRLLKAAFLEEQAPPYSKEQLQALGNRINHQKQELSAQKSEHFRALNLKQTVKTLHRRGQLKTLSDKEFSKILKETASLGRLDQIVPIALERLAQEQLKPLDLYYLAFGEYQEAANREALGSALFQLLDQQPALSSQILQMAAQISQTSLDYLEKTTTTGKFALWTLLEGQTTSAPALAPNKQSAKHQANRQWLAGKWAGTLTNPNQLDESLLLDAGSAVPSADAGSPESLETSDLSFLPEEAIQSPIAYLHDGLQQMKLKKPTYQYWSTDLGWKCRCLVQWLDGMTVEKEGEGSKKK